MAVNNRCLLLQDNSDEDEKRTIIFSTDLNLKLLSESETWFLDCNFSLAPKFFKQIYIIRIMKANMWLSAAFCLVQKKSQSTYEKMFQILIEESVLHNWFPDLQIVHMDFEKATINAVKAIFGNIIAIRGCFYHLRRKVLIEKYKIWDMRFCIGQMKNLFCSMVDGAIFLPLSDYHTATKLFKDKAQESQEDAEKEILDYFDATYITGLYRTALRRTTEIQLIRVPPQFLPQN